MAEDRSRWWVDATISTVVTVLLLALAGFFAMLALFAYDDCHPGGCPQTDQHITGGVTAMAASVVFLVAAWPAARFHGERVRSTLCLLAPTAALVSLTLLATTPAGH